MDEILIEEKKYVSSKRAAKMTGYAKDYIGQLCREGRVPARLVGRSWYVLETAIQDHRFGTPDEMSHPEPTYQPFLESPHYEASLDELLPSINQLRQPSGYPEAGGDTETHLQDSWRAWFDRVAETEVVAPAIEKPEATEDAEKKKEEEGEVNVPIHAVYRQPPEELLPRRHLEVRPPGESMGQTMRQKKQKASNSVMLRAIQVGGIVLATIAVAVAIIGSGYLDKYILSNSQVRIISGIGLYNK